MPENETASDELRPIRVVFRPAVAAENSPDPMYLATPTVIEQIAQDFAADRFGGSYAVCTMTGQPRVLALRFADVLRID